MKVGTYKGDAAVPAAEPCERPPRAFERRLRWVKRQFEVATLRLRLLQAQFLVLLAWYRVMGHAPRVLNYRPEVNVRLLRAFGARVAGRGDRLFGPLTLHGVKSDFSNLEIGENCVFNGNNLLDLSAPITIGPGASLGPGVTVMTHNAFNGNAYLTTRLAGMVGKGAVTIGAGAGIKAHAVILKGVTIGEEAVVASCALVKHDVPRRAFVVGVPAVVKEMLDPPPGGE